MLWILAAIALILAILSLISKPNNTALLGIAIILLSIAFLAQSYGIH